MVCILFILLHKSPFDFNSLFTQTQERIPLLHTFYTILNSPMNSLLHMSLLLLNDLLHNSPIAVFSKSHPLLHKSPLREESPFLHVFIRNFNL